MFMYIYRYIANKYTHIPTNIYILVKSVCVCLYSYYYMCLFFFCLL